MEIVRQGRKPIASPSAAQIAREIGWVRSNGPAGFVILTGGPNYYLQATGGPWLFLLERRLGGPAQHFRAHVAAPVVPFPDGTLLSTPAGKFALAADEWIPKPVVVEAFVSFAASANNPEELGWRLVALEH